ncbi:cell wall anchor protein, partial [Mariniflexile sp. HMF6888]
TGYSLTPLQKLQEYIITHGHLPNVPSAKDMETHGIELGIMNMKLLEKIEELTLYILQQQKELYLQSEKNKTLENRLIKLETLIKNKK